MNYSSYEHKSRTYINILAFNANLGAIGAGIFFVALNACIWEVMLVFQSEEFFNIHQAGLSAAIPFGGIFGGFFSSYSTNKIGRRKSMIIADLLTILGCLLTISTALPVMLIGRIICGFVVGLNYMVIPLYVREISPPDLSGRTGSYFRIFFTSGLLLAFAVSMGLHNPPTDDNALWRVIFTLPCLFALARLANFFIWIKMDTPKFYMEKDDEENAMAALEQIFRDDQVEQVYNNEKRFETYTLIDIFGSKYRSQTILVVFLILVTEFMGANALNFYTSIIFLNTTEETESDYQQMRVLNIIFAAIRLAAAILGRYIIDKVGRRPLLIYGNLLCMLLAFAIFSSDAVSFLIGQQSIVMIYSAVQGLTFTMVLPIYAAELLPTFGIGLQVIIQMLCIMLVTLYFPFVGVEYSFLMFGIIGLVSFVPIFKMAKETRGKTVNEVYRMFQAEKGSGLLDQEVEVGVGVGVGAESDGIHDLGY